MQQIKADEPFYQISQVSKLLGITSDRLRTYEEEGLIKPFRSNNSKDGKRLFSQNDIEWLIIVRNLIKLGVSIPTIRVLLFAILPTNVARLREKDKQIIEQVKNLKSHTLYKSIISL